MLPPGKVACHFARVGIEQQAPGIEALAALWCVGAMHPVRVAQSRSRTGEIAVPDLIGRFAQRQRAHPRALEDAQFDRFGVRRKEREVDAASVPTGAERPRPPGFESAAFAQGIHSKYSAASGGSVRLTDHSRPCAGTGSAGSGS